MLISFEDFNFIDKGFREKLMLVACMKIAMKFVVFMEEEQRNAEKFWTHFTSVQTLIRQQGLVTETDSLLSQQEDLNIFSVKCLICW